MSQNNLNEYVHFHREGENPRMQSHLNIPMGAQVKEVIETSTGVRGSNLKKSMFTQRHMTLYETELNSAQEHLQRAAEAAKMGDWRAHDALVETALARQKSAEMHWNKCHY
jgi:N-acetylglutamate synthase/N-acetylornithine aminotransferase